MFFLFVFLYHNQFEDKGHGKVNTVHSPFSASVFYNYMCILCLTLALSKI